MPQEDSVDVTPTVNRPERRRDLDLMRMFVVVGLVFFHTARIFDTGDFYVKNDPTSELVSIAMAFAAMWGMPLLFVISGMGIWYSLRSRTMKAFSWERVRRLLVPLVFGVLVIVPPQIWTRLRASATTTSRTGNSYPDSSMPNSPPAGSHSWLEVTPPQHSSSGHICGSWSCFSPSRCSFFR